MDVLSDKRLSSDEYEKQYFGFSSTEFYEDLREQIWLHINRALDDVKKTLVEALTDKKMDISDVEQQMNNIKLLYWQKIQQPMDKLEVEVRKIFAIPASILLDSDSHNVELCTNNDLQSLEKEVIDLENMVLQEKKYLNELNNEKAKLDLLSGLYETTQQVIEAIHQNNKQEKKKGITDLLELRGKFERMLSTSDSNSDRNYVELFAPEASVFRPT